MTLSFPAERFFLSHAFVSAGLSPVGTVGPDSALRRALTSCMPILEESLRTVVVIEATDDSRLATTESSCSNDRVERVRSVFKSRPKCDLAIIAAHNEQLVNTKFNNSTSHVPISIG